MVHIAIRVRAVRAVALVTAVVAVKRAVAEVTRAVAAVTLHPAEDLLQSGQHVPPKVIAVFVLCQLLN